jgi:hypothetical protein
MDKWSRDYADSLHLVEKVLRQAKEHSNELLKVQVAKASPQTTDPDKLPIMDDWSTTQSTIGIMTPTEDWSDLSSDTTEIVHTPPITRHSLQLCGYATANFLRLISDIQSSYRNLFHVRVDDKDLQRLHEAYDELVVHLLHALDAPVPSQSHLLQYSSPSHVVSHDSLAHTIRETKNFSDDNNIIEESFGHLPGSTPLGASDIEVMHKAYANLVETLLGHLAAPVPFQTHRSTPTPAPASVPAPVPEVPRPATPNVQSNVCIDKALDAIINSMEPTPTDKDIMKLVFHWTTLEECNGFKRAEVMKLD